MYGANFDCQTGFSMLHFYDFLGLELPEIVKLLPVAHN